MPIIPSISGGGSNNSPTFHGIETAGTISFNSTTHVLTLNTSGGAITYWYLGTSYTTAAAITCDIDAYETLTTNKLYFFYFDDATGTLKCSDSAWSILTDVPVATVFWNGSSGAIVNEKHTHDRNLDWHSWAHYSIGARIANDGGFSQTAPTIAADTTVSITSGVLYDEDLETITGTQTNVRHWYQVPGGAYTFEDSTRPTLWNGGTSRVRFPDSDHVTPYTLADATNSQFVPVWVYASPDIDRPIYIITPSMTAAYTTLASARNATPPNLVAMGLQPEMKLLYRWIFRGDGEYQEAADYRTSGTVPSGGITGVNAASVIFTASGNIASTNVQAAIEELDDEKAGTSHTHSPYFANYTSAPTAISAPTTLIGSDLGKRYSVSTYSIAGVTSASADTVTYSSHGLLDGDAVVPQSTAAGLTSGVIYFVRDSAASTFKVAATPGGAAIDLSADATITFKCSYRITLPSASGIYGAIIFEVASDLVGLVELYGDSTSIEKCWANDILVVSSNGTSWNKGWIKNAAKTITSSGSAASIVLGPLDMNAHGGYVLDYIAWPTSAGLFLAINQDTTTNNYDALLGWAYQVNSKRVYDSYVSDRRFSGRLQFQPIIGTYTYYHMIGEVVGYVGYNYKGSGMLYKNSATNVYAIQLDTGGSGNFADGGYFALRRMKE